MRQFLDVVFLAILQGVTEFLPISSSGHLVVAQQLLGLERPGVTLEVVLHIGTMFSIIIFYRKKIQELISGVFEWKRESLLVIAHIALSAVPAVIFYLLFKARITAFFENSFVVGGFLTFTGVVLCAQRWMRCGNGGMTAPRALLTGMAQAIAILPGVSRSGMTISVARMSGVAPAVAAEFSFLMCLPLLAGASLLEVVELRGGASVNALPWCPLLVGALVSAAVGYIALSFLVRLLKGGRFWMFGVYCLLAGVLTMLVA